MRKETLLNQFLCCYLFLLPTILFAKNSEMQTKPSILIEKNDLPITNEGSMTFKNFIYDPKKMASFYNKTANSNVENTIPIFNNWFKTNVQTKEELMTAITQLISHYYNNLRQCIPGTYHYTQPNILFGLKNRKNRPEFKYFYVTSIVYGQKDDKCAVMNIIEKNDRPLRTLCFYSATSLSFYTDEQAKAAAINYMRYQDAELNKIQQIADECKVLPFNQSIT